MISYLTPEQASALQAGGNAPMQIVDPSTRRVFYMIDSSLLAELERRSDLDAIREGVSDMQAGSSVPIDQARTTDRAVLVERFVAINSLNLTKVLMMAMLTSIARSLVNTLDNIETPCSVKAFGK